MKSLHLAAGLPFLNSAPTGGAARGVGLCFESRSRFPRLWIGLWIFGVGFFGLEQIAKAAQCTPTTDGVCCASSPPPYTTCTHQSDTSPLGKSVSCPGQKVFVCKKQTDQQKERERLQQDREKRNQAEKTRLEAEEKLATKKAEQARLKEQEAKLAKNGWDKNAPGSPAKTLGGSSSALGGAAQVAGSTTSAASTTPPSKYANNPFGAPGSSPTTTTSATTPGTTSSWKSATPNPNLGLSRGLNQLSGDGTVLGSSRGAAGSTPPQATTSTTTSAPAVRAVVPALNLSGLGSSNNAPPAPPPPPGTQNSLSPRFNSSDPYEASFRRSAIPIGDETPRYGGGPRQGEMPLRQAIAEGAARINPAGGSPLAGGGAVGRVVNPAATLPLLPPAGGVAGAAAAAGAPVGVRSGTNVDPNYRNSGDYRGEGTSDPCSLSAKVDGKYSCAGTVQFGQTAQMMNMATMMMGSSVAQSAGQAAQMNVINSGSSQKDALENSANASETTGKVQGAIGMANAAMSIMLLKKGSDHTGFAGEIKTGAGQVTAQQGTSTENTTDYRSATAKGRLDDSGNSVGSKIVQRFGFNETATVTKVDSAATAAVQAEQRAMREQENQQHLEWGRSQARRIANEADSEQKTVSQTAKMQGFMGAMIAGQQIMGAAAAMKNAANMRASAAKLGEQTNNAPFIKPDAMPGNMADGAQSGGNPDLITGNGDNPNAAPADSTAAPTGDSGDLGQGFNPNPLPSDIAAAPTAGKFAGGKPEGGGGGGPAAVGGGSTSAANSSPEETQAKPVANQGSEKYESGGTFSGAGGGGKGAEGGPDLNSVLGMLLPKDKDAEKKPDSILKFGAQGPGGQPGDLVHNERTNLFDAVHEEYAKQNQKGNIGAN